MKKCGPIEYRDLFLKHLWRFTKTVASPHELAGNHAVAVSGGLDSMALLWCVNRWSRENKIGPVRAIFVHHATRSGQDADQAMIENFCQEEKIPLTVLTVAGLSGNMANFEARARRARRKACLEEIKNELLWVGHHLDDSYEWNFMQRHRSTNPKSSIGIPVRNGPIIRPFLCVTRAQIKRISKFESIPFREDPTNWDLRFERNYIRHKIIPRIRKNYPRYLKFYSHFANFSAMVLKVSLLRRRGPSKLFVYEKGAAILGKHYSELQIQELIHNYSNTDRGEIITPIERMLKAIENNKKGPFHFSGGVEAYHTHGLLMLYPQKMQNYDESIARVLSGLNRETLAGVGRFTRPELERAWQNLLRSADALSNLPGLVLVLESESVCKTMNTSVFDPMFPAVSKVCQEKGLRFLTFQKCLDVWMQKKEKLPGSLGLLPLSNLSNLFASQR